MVSIYLNCFGDIEEGTDRQKGVLELEIKESYNAIVAKRLNIMNKRTMKAIKRCWRQINEGVTLLESHLTAAGRMRASGEFINDTEAKEHDLYKQKKGVDTTFQFYHCWVAMQHLPKWMSSRDSIVVGEGSSKRSSDETGKFMRPDGVKKVKAQNKFKGVAISLDESNNTLSGMQNEQGLMRLGMFDMLEYQKQRDHETKMRFKLFQLLMTKSYS